MNDFEERGILTIHTIHMHCQLYLIVNYEMPNST